MLVLCVVLCVMCSTIPTQALPECPAATLECDVERNPATFASNWVPLWTGAVDPDSKEVRPRLPQRWWDSRIAELLAAVLHMQLGSS